jgi:hypothetical protein
MNPVMSGTTNMNQAGNTRQSSSNNFEKHITSTLNNAKISSTTNYEIKDSGFSSNNNSFY